MTQVGSGTLPFQRPPAQTGASSHGAEISLGVVTAPRRIEQRGNFGRFSRQVEAARITREAAIEAARLRAISAVLSSAGRQIARKIKHLLRLQF